MGDPTKARLKGKRAARCMWFMELCLNVKSQGGAWATVGGMTYRFEKPKHPWNGKAVVQIDSPQLTEIELMDVKAQMVTDAAGTPTLIYWARRRGAGTRQLVYPQFVLAVVTASHRAKDRADVKVGEIGEEGTATFVKTCPDP